MIMKKGQVFISHSSRDRNQMQFFQDLFDDTNVKPIFMEFEKWSRNYNPNWLWIRKEIRKSKALFVVLTKNITERKHTQNWVSFEIGVAAGCKPPLPIFVFREEDVDFPVPCLTWFFDEPVTRVDHLEPQEFSEVLLDFLILLFRYQVLAHVFASVLDPSPPNQGNEFFMKCNNCYLQFNYFGMNNKIHCPCCNHLIDTPLSSHDESKTRDI
jgi:hypothetical protein